LKVFLLRSKMKQKIYRSFVLGLNLPGAIQVHILLAGRQIEKCLPLQVTLHLLTKVSWIKFFMLLQDNDPISSHSIQGPHELLLLFLSRFLALTCGKECNASIVSGSPAFPAVSWLYFFVSTFFYTCMFSLIICGYSGCWDPTHAIKSLLNHQQPLQSFTFLTCFELISSLSLFPPDFYSETPVFLCSLLGYGVSPRPPHLRAGHPTCVLMKTWNVVCCGLCWVHAIDVTWISFTSPPPPGQPCLLSWNWRESGRFPELYLGSWASYTWVGLCPSPWLGSGCRSKKKVLLWRRDR
jgi:hypothetical protein